MSGEIGRDWERHPDLLSAPRCRIHEIHGCAMCRERAVALLVQEEHDQFAINEAQIEAAVRRLRPT